jgi:nucleoside-diphosphate-sugar epimerase
MNILITGLHGFVGSNLVQLLSKENTIYGLDIITPYKEGVAKTFLWNQLSEIPHVDAIIHLAGKAHDTKNKAKAGVYFEVNTGLTKKIYDYYLTSDAEKFMFFSTVKAAADSVVGDFLTEEIVPSPKGPYGESKIAAENYILSHPSANKTFYILRPCMIHGPGNKGNLNLLYKVVKKGIPWPLGAFENRRSFTSVDNLCFAVDGLLTKDVPSGIYNIGDDEALSTNELIQTICETMDRPVRIWHISSKLMRSIAHIGSLLHFPLNDERLQKLTENYVVSNSKIKKALGIERMPVSAKEGLIKTIRSFK